MKRILAFLLAAVLTLGVLLTGALAAAPGETVTVAVRVFAEGAVSAAFRLEADSGLEFQRSSGENGWTANGMKFTASEGNVSSGRAGKITFRISDGASAGTLRVWCVSAHATTADGETASIHVEADVIQVEAYEAPRQESDSQETGSSSGESAAAADPAEPAGDDGEGNTVTTEAAAGTENAGSDSNAEGGNAGLTDAGAAVSGTENAGSDSNAEGGNEVLMGSGVIDAGTENTGSDENTATVGSPAVRMLRSGGSSVDGDVSGEEEEAGSADETLNTAKSGGTDPLAGSVLLSGDKTIYLRPDWRVPPTTVGKYIGNGMGVRVWTVDQGDWIALYTNAEHTGGVFAWILKCGFVITPGGGCSFTPVGGCSGLTPCLPTDPECPATPVYPAEPVHISCSLFPCYPGYPYYPWIPVSVLPCIIPVKPATAGLTEAEIAAGYEEWSRQWLASLPKGWIPGRMKAPFPPREFWETYKANRKTTGRTSSGTSSRTVLTSASAAAPSSGGGKNWRRDQTVSSMGLRFRDVTPYLTDKWFMFTPLDLTREGSQVLPLIAANTSFVGSVTVNVSGGNVTVNYNLNSGVDLGDLNYTFFSGLDEVSSVEISPQDRLAFGEPVSIGEELDDAEIVLLYLSGHVSYNYKKQPRFHPTGRDYRKAAASYRLLVD